MDTKQLAISIGAAFIAARYRRGLTCVQAAELLCLQVDFYGRIEAGDSLPTILTCARAVEVLGVDPFALFGAAASTVDVAPRYVAECATFDRSRADTAQKIAHADRLARDAMERKLSDAHRDFAEARGAYESTIATLSTEVERLRHHLLEDAEETAIEAEAHRDQIGAQAVMSVHDLTSERSAAMARAESLAAECEALQEELGRVRAERDYARDDGIEWARSFVGARDRIDALEAERETLRLLANLRDEDPDVTEHPDQIRIDLGTGLTPAGPVILSNFSGDSQYQSVTIRGAIATFCAPWCDRTASFNAASLATRIHTLESRGRGAEFERLAYLELTGGHYSAGDVEVQQ